MTRKLFEKGLRHDAIQNLYKFIDWLLTLPEDLTVRYNEAVHALEKEFGMEDYPLTTAERIGRKKGEYALLLKLLKRKFPNLSEEDEQKLAQADEDTLFKWGENLLSAETLDQVFKQH